MGKQDGGSRKIIATNRRARFDYEIDDTYEAGLVLRGSEVKVLRGGKVTIGEGYVRIERGEAWLVDVHIPEYTNAGYSQHEPTRPRKLLLHDHEIERIGVAIREKGYTAVPMELYFRDGRVKLLIGLGKGRKNIDKRRHEREKDDRREMDRYRG
jgi:SsrA-binding protein